MLALEYIYIGGVTIVNCVDLKVSTNSTMAGDNMDLRNILLLLVISLIMFGTAYV